MTLKTEAYTRVPFLVNAIQVTKDNVDEVADWCKGTVHSSTKTVHGENGTEPTKVKVPFVKVDVHRPLNDRQTKAFPGDWILESESGFKVYTQRAFENSFQKSVDIIDEPRSIPTEFLSTTTPEQLAAIELKGLSVPRNAGSNLYTDKDGKDQLLDEIDGRERFPEPTVVYTEAQALAHLED